MTPAPAPDPAALEDEDAWNDYDCELYGPGDGAAAGPLDRS